MCPFVTQSGVNNRPNSHKLGVIKRRPCLALFCCCKRPSGAQLGHETQHSEHVAEKMCKITTKMAISLHDQVPCHIYIYIPAQEWAGVMSVPSSSEEGSNKLSRRERLPGPMPQGKGGRWRKGCPGTRGQRPKRNEKKKKTKQRGQCHCSTSTSSKPFIQCRPINPRLRAAGRSQS